MPATRTVLPAQTRRGLLVTAGVIGGELPDLDLVLTFGRDKLAYLLHHRGHTHTVIGCIAFALVMYALMLAWLRWRRLAPAPAGRRLPLAFSLGAVLLHLLMDAMNSYGVHPFWPVDNRWYYGDSVFIVEPLYWIAAVPLIFTMRTLLARIALGLALLGALGALTFVYRAAPLFYVAPGLLALALGAMAWRATPRSAAIAAASTMVLVTVGFVAAGSVAEARIAAVAATELPAMRTLDRALTPGPANPFCWDLLLVQVDEQRYVARRATVSLAPGVMPAARCPQVMGAGPGTAPLVAVSAPSTSTVQWRGEHVLPRNAIRRIVARNCDALQLMQFVRVPFAVVEPERTILGDLRFDREPGPGLAELDIPTAPQRTCRYDLPWMPPRADLLKQAP